MKSRTAFSKKEVVVVLGCVVFLLANLGAIGSRGRQRAKEAGMRKKDGLEETKPAAPAPAPKEDDDE